MNQFQSIHDYEEFIYTIAVTRPSITGSTLAVIRRGKGSAILRGELRFAGGYRLLVQERLAIENSTVIIESYGYEIWGISGKLAWYDSQPHPNDPILARTLPHHKHIPPDLKHNRIPAVHIYFTQPNLPVLIEEIEELLSSNGRLIVP
ncbi:MAG: hypothetical protein A2511_10850 [Deltaproteobacteria bacterium RIFOXYD12_FULL_50_9]|nr:MAG: hypothetical protein A2511_10850 [Deltaproteobacteria bacterium RIFOXYD12_FULL_50_9]